MGERRRQGRGDARCRLRAMTGSMGERTARNSGGSGVVTCGAKREKAIGYASSDAGEGAGMRGTMRTRRKHCRMRASVEGHRLGVKCVGVAWRYEGGKARLGMLVGYKRARRPRQGWRGLWLVAGAV